MESEAKTNYTMELSYESIKGLLGDCLLAEAEAESGESIILARANFGEEAFTASWVSKRHGNAEWWCTHVYHEDGTVEELFERVEAE